MFAQRVAALFLLLGVFGCPAPAPTSQPTVNIKTTCAQGEVVADGKCFPSAKEACTVIGCPEERCVVTRSLPPHASCAPAVLCNPNQTIAGNRCFDTQQAACESLGCGASCLIMESAPAKAVCQQPK